MATRTSEIPARMSFEEFEQWREQRLDERYEFIDGAPLRMMAEAEAHGDAINAVSRQFNDQLPEGAPCRVRTQNSAVRVGDDLFEPDVIIHCGDRDPTRKYVTDPSVVVEVTSDSTRRRDYLTKMPAYEQIEGLAASILIDLQNGTAFVYRPGDANAPEFFQGEGRVELKLTEDFTVSLDFTRVFRAAGLPPKS